MAKLTPDSSGFRAYVKRRGRRGTGRRFKGSRRARRRLLATKRMMRSVAASVVTSKAETKQVVDTQTNLDVSGANGVFVQLTDIDQGITDANRIGNTCSLKSLVVNTQVIKNGAAASDFVRTIIVKAPDGQDVAAAGPGFFLQNPTNAYLSQYKTIKEETTATEGRYRILYDEIQELNSTKTADWNRIRLNFKKGLELQYADTTGDTQSKNSVYLWVKSADAANTAPWGYHVRSYFTDT